LIDCHLHLQDPRFSPDLPDVLRRASAAGVSHFACNGTCESDWPAVAQLAIDHPSIFPCFGLHPWYVNLRSPDWLTKLESFLDAQPSAVGEIGLDQWIKDRDEPAMEDVFRLQLDLAVKKHRPVTIHCLHAWPWLMKVLRSEKSLPDRLLIHAYGGPVELIDELSAMNAYFSFAGTILDEKRARTRSALLAVPTDRLLLETDSPDLNPPAGFRLSADRNEPANLSKILPAVANILGQSPENLAKILKTNSERFFNGFIKQ
jgi:TatD DNase family protein